MKIIKYLLLGIGIILLAGVIAFFAWFHNPHEHTLQLDPVAVYSNQAEGHLITQANIIDVESGSLMVAHHILIRDGVITQIFTGSIPDSLTENYSVVDANGKYIMPALFDMHTHLNSGGLIPPAESTRLVALEQFARYGVGTIFTLGGMGFNQEVTAGLIQQQENRELVSPKIFAAGDILTNPGGYPIPFLARMLGITAEEIDLNEQGMLEVTEATDLDAIISKKRELGLNGVKVMVESRIGSATPESRLSNEVVERISQTALNHRLPVFAHVTSQNDFEDAVNSGVDVIAHLMSSDSLSNATSILETMREDSIRITPTLLMSYRVKFLESANMLNDPFYQQYSSERTTRSFENWPIRQMILRNMGQDPEAQKQRGLQNFNQIYKAGVTVMMGTDAGNPTIFPGYSAHKELEFMAEAGMSNTDVLRTATIIPARFLGIENVNGSIAEGKTANFLILDGNPLEDVRNTQSIERVMLEGYWIE